jgi:autotransporter-associated beta strand protein
MNATEESPKPKTTKTPLITRNRLSTRSSGTLKLAVAFAVLAVVCTQDTGAATLTWTGSAGAASNVWNVGTTANWLKGGAPSVFNNNDAVTFDGTGSTNSTVNLTTTVLPASATVNSANNYTFTNSGSGVLGGSGTLTKLGSGGLYLRSANTYSGGTTITVGYVQIFDANALGTGVLTLNSGSSGANGLWFGANVAAGNGGRGVTNDIFMKGNSLGNMLSAAGLLSGKISGPGNWAWNGFSAGSLTLSGDNSGWSGGFKYFGPNIHTLYLGHTNALGSGTVTMEVGTLPVVSAAADLSGGQGVTNAIVMSGNSMAINLTNDLLLSGPISGSGNLVKNGRAKLILGGNNPFTGGTTVSNGTLAVNGRLNGAVEVASSAVLGGIGTISGLVTVDPNAILQPGLGGADTSTLTISNDVNLAGSTLLTLNRTNPQNASLLAISGRLTYGGTLTVSNAGVPVRGGDSFTLFRAGSYASDFSISNLPVLSDGLKWVWTPTNGTLSAGGSAVTNTVNVRGFGAKGDGLTDDTAAIQAALNHAAARLSANGLQRAGAAVVFPSGTYIVSHRLTFLTTNTLPNGQGLTIRGEGMTNTILLSINETGSGLLYFDLQSPVLNSGFKLQIEDIGLQSARAISTSGAAIEIAPRNTNTVNVWPTLRAVKISGYSPNCGFDYGFRAKNLNRSIMDRVVVCGQSDEAKKMKAGLYYDYCYGPVLRDCLVSGAQTGMVFTNGGEGTMLNRCTITNTDTAIYIHVGWNYMPPSSFDGKVLNSLICANTSGIYMCYKSYITVANNTFERQGSLPGYADITMEDVRNGFISENVFSGSESERTGIKLSKNQHAGEYNSIAENSFGSFPIGVWLGTSLDRTRILANSNLATAALADYGNKTFFQPIYTNWLRSLHVSLAAVAGEELHPWEVFHDGRRIVNVADYGATGDGTTDDSAAVSNAFADFVTELNLDRPAGLYFPAGTYKLSQPLKAQFSTTGKNAAVFGDGMNVSTIDWRGASFLELIDTGVSATVLDIHHLRIATPATVDDSVILSVNQGASMGTNRSFRAYDMSIGTYNATYGSSPRYGIGIAGVGLKNPLFRNVLVENYESGLYSGNNGIYGSGLVLTNGIGFEAEYLRIFNKPNAMNINSAGGSIVVKNCHEFSVGGDVKINAGSGAVAIQGAHINSTNNLDISHASAVSLTDTLFLGASSTNRNSDEGTLRLTACTNVIVRNNEFGTVDPIINPLRFSIRLGEGCQNVEIAGNHFGEGIGFIIPAGAVNVKAFENRFLNLAGTDIVCKEPTAKILMLPGEEDPDLAAIWKLDEGAGTNVHGQCYGLDGDISGAAWVSGKYGTGLKFNGVDNSVTVVQYPEAFRYIMTNFTIMAWVKPEKAIGGDEMSGQNYALYPTLGVQPPGELLADHVAVGVSVGTNRIKVVERTGDIFNTSLDFTGAISSSEWTHVAVAYSNSMPRLYINGVLRATGSVGTKIPHPGCWGGGSYGWYQGALDEYRVYRRALSATDIVALGTAIPKTWTGDGGTNLWDINTSTNWAKPDDSLMPAVFNNNDAVTFDGLGSANPMVNLTATVSPAAVMVNSASDYTFSNSGGSLGGSGRLTKLGNGYLNLRGANTYSGGTTIGMWGSTWGGTILLFDANALGTGVLTMNGGWLWFGANVAAGNGGLGVTNDIALLAAPGNINTLSFAGKLSGKISGPGNLGWNGFSSGSMTLSGDNSGWSGGFYFSGPITLYLGHTNALGSGPLTMDAGTSPVISTAADLSGGLGVTNAIIMSGNPATINLTNNLLLSGPISGDSNFVKSGSATLILGGSNTFTGKLTISDGPLFVNSPGVLSAGSTVAVNAGGTLGGNGTLNGAVTINPGGMLAPGTNAIGLLHINNALTLAAGSRTVMEISKTLGTSDAVVGLASVSYSGTLTIINLGGTLVAGDHFKLFDAAGYSGGFATIVPEFPGAGLAWDTSTLTSDGTLRVVGCGPNILTQPSGRAAVVGGAASFLVTAATFPGKTNYYQWRFEGVAVPGATDRTLAMSSVQATNFGGYSVVVNNGQCDSYSLTVQLTHAVSPAFLPIRLNLTTISLSFPTESGPIYLVEYKNALTDATWMSLSSLGGTGGTETVTDTIAISLARFYRIRVQ